MYERFVPTIERIEEEGPIQASSVDLTVHHPAAVKQKSEGFFRHAQVTEIEVPMSADIARTFLPNMSTVFARALDAWERQEGGHGQRLGDAMDVIGINRMPVRQRATKTMELLGRLARVSPGLHDTIEYTTLVYMADGEKETVVCYPRFAHKFRSEGEISLATLITRIGRQEVPHLELWGGMAREKREDLRPYQRGIARRVIVDLSMPVGTHRGKKDIERHRSFGQAAFEMVGEGDLHTFTDPIERLAADLLDMSGNLKPFMRKRYEQCIREYLESIAG